MVSLCIKIFLLGLQDLFDNLEWGRNAGHTRIRGDKLMIGLRSKLGGSVWSEFAVQLYFATSAKRTNVSVKHDIIFT